MNLNGIGNKDMNKSYKVLIMSKTMQVLAAILFLFSFTRCQEDGPPPPPIKLTGTVANVSVFGGSDGAIDLNISGGQPDYSFLWSNNDTTEDLVELQAGIYSVIVTDKADQTAKDTFEVQQPKDGVMDADGNIYSTVKIGEQTWMGENLRVTHAPDGSEITSYSYYEDSDSIKKYGRLYNWDAAMNGSKTKGAQGICPNGWHVPTDNDFKKLEMHLGMTQSEADMINTWRGAPVGTLLKTGGNSGYEAQLSGRRSSSGTFSLARRMEYMWTSNPHGTSMAWRRCLDLYSPEVGRWNTFPKSYCFSIRCIKDD